ncbi:MAG: bifunctional UDP-sugar hydrolase/5'-nucleotidase [Chloroflexota bacterium]
MKTSDTGQQNLLLVRATANPADPEAGQLFLLKGDATRENLNLEISTGAQLPAAWHYDNQPFQLKILHFNDLHGQVARVSRKENTPIFSKMVSRIQHTRSACRGNPFTGVLVLSGGDDIIGTPFDMLVGKDPESYQVHAGYHLYSKAGVAASVLGNHEFDLGLDLLAHAIRKDAAFPILSANIKPNRQLENVCDPAALFYLKGVRIGIIGLTTPAAAMRSRQGSEFEIVDPIPVVKRLLPIVRSLSDVVIILSHLGLSLSSSSASMAFAGDVELAQNLPFGSVDLIIGSHTHDLINKSGLDSKNVVNGIPITQAGCNGSYLGEVDIVLRDAPTVANVCLNETADLPLDIPFDENYVQPLIEQLRPKFEKRLGRVMDSQEISSDGLYAVALGESALHNFVADGLVARCRAHELAVDFGMVDASVINSGIRPDTDFTYGDWQSVMPYADTLVLFTLTGKELCEFIQDNARRVDIFEEPHQERGFQYFSKEIRYCIQCSPTRSRIKAVDIKVSGIPIEQNTDRIYRVACISFFRALSRNWEQQTIANMPLLVFDPKQAQGVDTGLFVGDLMLEHIQYYDGITSAGGALQDGRLIVF